MIIRRGAKIWKCFWRYIHSSQKGFLSEETLPQNVVFWDIKWSATPDYSLCLLFKTLEMPMNILDMKMSETDIVQRALGL